VIQLTFKDGSEMLFNTRGYHWRVGQHWLEIESDDKRKILFPRDMMKKVVIQDAEI
jgi:hypothetical protein